MDFRILSIHQLLQFLNFLVCCKKLHGHILVLTDPILMRLVFPIVIARKMLNEIVFLTIHSDLAWRNFLSTLVLYKLLKLFNSVVLQFDVLLCLSIDSIISIKLFLELNDGLISLIQPTGKRNHDIPLLNKDMLVSVYLLHVFFNLASLLLNFLNFFIILFPNQPLAFFKS